MDGLVLTDTQMRGIVYLLILALIVAAGRVAWR